LFATVVSAPQKLYGARELLKELDVFIFDCDGVIWKGDSLIPGVPAVLDKLREQGNFKYLC
jgi:ribonucleotide monophosphatase NagD (HAD superfamily)